jgi:hypothetical protein
MAVTSVRSTSLRISRYRAMRKDDVLFLQYDRPSHARTSSRTQPALARGLSVLACVFVACLAASCGGDDDDDDKSTRGRGSDGPQRGTVLCSNTCEFAFDDECDDGGPGADFDECELGTDCGDCGPLEL